MARIIRHGTVDLSNDVRSASQIARAAAEQLPEGASYGEAIEALQATIVELREAASRKGLREAEKEIRREEARGGSSLSSKKAVLERLAALDAELASSERPISREEMKRRVIDAREKAEESEARQTDA